MEPSFVEVQRFRLLHEAQLAAATLEASGITSEIRDNFLSGAEPDLVNAVGGIALLVGESDVLAAREILSTDFSEAVPQSDLELPGTSCAGCGQVLRSAFAECAHCNALPERRAVLTPKQTHFAILKVKLAVVVGTLVLVAIPLLWDRFVGSLTSFSEKQLSVLFYSVAGLVIAAILIAGLSRISEKRL